jgi:spermidine synthase
MFILFAVTLLVSAGLLMVVQPLCARMLLPVLGGTPAVWNTCMVFFQAGLLAGYGYAHLTSRWLPGAGQRLLHLVVVAAAALTLPAVISAPATPPGLPAAWLLTALLVSVGLPYVVVASTAPLLQRWFADAGSANPYVLYAASNAGSFLGLLAYPLVVEPALTLAEQAEGWRWGFLGMTALTAACALGSWRGRAGERAGAAAGTSVISWPARLRWLLLALAPSSLLLSVTGYLTTDIAPVPLLWIIPLALYLLTFTMVFAARVLIPHAAVLRVLPAVLIVLMLLLLYGANEPLWLVLGLHLLGFFWLALACHGELARTRPPARHLTEFYLWVALGGVLGGAFNALVAPLVFTSYVEYPLMLVLVAALRPAGPETEAGGLRAWQSEWQFPVILGGATAAAILFTRLGGSAAAGVAALIYAVPLVVCYLVQFNVRRFALALAAVLLASALDPGVHGAADYRARSFFGVHRVSSSGGMRRLIHGNTQHGVQFLDAAKRHIPLAYYHPTGPIGRLLTAWRDDPRRRRVGLVGLGAGALAAYAQPGDSWTFFEIDPDVVYIARDSGLFTYLPDKREQVGVVVGDARLTLQQTEEKFGLLVIDAFGSDSIPVHLLTREAMELYRSRLQPGGVLAVHISNRYVNLEPVLASHAEAQGLVCYVVEDLSASSVTYPGKSPSVWAFLAARRQDLGEGELPGLRPAEIDPDLREWTDHYTNLLRVLRWR